MIIYHGSGEIVKNPEVRKGRYTKDFGVGFYCTNIKQQAIKWSMKFDIPTLNIYRFDCDNSLNIKEFKTINDEWLDFIVNCRNGKPHNYDIVIGAMADDQIYNYVTDFINGTISREAFWVLVKFNYPTHQIAFCTQKSLKCIKYKEGVIINA